MNERGADPDLVAAWIAGWATCRGTAAPVAIPGGWRVEVGWPDQQARMVFPEAGDALAQAAEATREPYVFLKACVPVERLRPLLPERWEAERRGFMMSVADLPDAPSRLPQGYRMVQEADGQVTLARVLAADGAQAAWGRVARSGRYAVFDRIVTEEAHRRRGLAREVMGVLHAAGRRSGARGGLLVATPMGRRLYQSLGWRVHAPYASAVIPGD